MMMPIPIPAQGKAAAAAAPGAAVPAAAPAPGGRFLSMLQQAGADKHDSAKPHGFPDLLPGLLGALLAVLQFPQNGDAATSTAPAQAVPGTAAATPVVGVAQGQTGATLATTQAAAGKPAAGPHTPVRGAEDANLTAAPATLPAAAAKAPAPGPAPTLPLGAPQRTQRGEELLPKTAAAVGSPVLPQTQDTTASAAAPAAARTAAPQLQALDPRGRTSALPRANDAAPAPAATVAYTAGTPLAAVLSQAGGSPVVAPHGPEAPPALLPAATLADPVSAAQFQASADGGRLQLSLQPSGSGAPIHITLDLVGGALAGQIVAPAHAAEQLQQLLPELESRLVQQGLALSHFGLQQGPNGGLGRQQPPLEEAFQPSARARPAPVAGITGARRQREAVTGLDRLV